MKVACTVGVIASLIMGTAAQTKAGDAELQPRVTSEAQKLLTGDSPPVGIGVVRAAVKGENLEIRLSVQEGCFIESSHLCNVPTKTFTASDGATQVPYSIPLFDVYEFVCMYESDFFVIAGHAQVVCKQEQTAEQKAEYKQHPVRKLQERGLYEAYYEIPIECASASETTAGPIATKGEPLVTKGQPLTRATLATLATLATKGELATRGELALATKQTFATLATKQSLETYAPKSELIQSEQKVVESAQKLIESEQKLIESEQKVILPQENQIESIKVVNP